MAIEHEQGPKIKLLRTLKGLSQAELARAIGRTQPYISNVERDFGQLTPSEARIVERLLGLGKKGL